MPMRVADDRITNEWPSYSRVQQMALIGDCVRAAIQAKRREDYDALRAAFRGAIERFLLTFADRKWIDRSISPGGLKEPAIACAVSCDALIGENEYHTDLDSLDRYFMQFAIAARAGR